MTEQQSDKIIPAPDQLTLPQQRRVTALATVRVLFPQILSDQTWAMARWILDGKRDDESETR